MSRIMGATLVILALIVAIVPIFSDCQSQGRSLTTKDGKIVSMKCHWSGVAEIGVAIPMALVGIFSLRKQRKATSRYLAAIGLTSGVLAILFPTALIGVCANPDMICNLVMRPILIAAGVLAVVASLVLFISGRDSGEQAV